MMPRRWRPLDFVSPWSRIPSPTSRTLSLLTQRRSINCASTGSSTKVTLSELVDIAAQVDEEKEPGSGSALRNASWHGLSNGRDFQARYKRISVRQSPGLKGESWGRALARCALKSPYRGDNREERPLTREIAAALRARMAHYDFQKENFGFDIATFEAIDLRPRRASSDT
jgi:hypothetical protein